MGCLGMPVGPGNTPVGQPLPQDLPRVFVNAVHPEFMHRAVVHLINVTVKSHLERIMTTAADSRGKEQPLIPDHGAGVSQPGDPDLPTDVLPGTFVLLFWQIQRVDHPAGERSPELGPLFLIPGLGQPLDSQPERNQDRKKGFKTAYGYGFRQKQRKSNCLELFYIMIVFIV
jgi:hypothetical protein